MCSTGNLHPTQTSGAVLHRHLRPRTLLLLVLCSAEHLLSLRNAAAQLCPLQQPLPQFCAALGTPAPCGAPRPASLSTTARAVPISAALHQTPPARNGTHPSCLAQHPPMQAVPLQRCAVPGIPAAFPPPSIVPLCPHTDPAPLRLCLLPSSRGKTTQGRFWGSRSGHPLQHPVPAGDIAAHGSTVWGIDPSLPCPLTIRSKIAYTSLWVIPRSCLPRLGPLPCGLALGTCTAEIGALQRLSLDLQTDPSSSYVCGKTHVGQTLSAPYLLFHYCSIATFSCYKEMFMIYNKINPEIVLLYGC